MKPFMGQHNTKYTTTIETLLAPNCEAIERIRWNGSFSSTTLVRCHSPFGHQRAPHHAPEHTFLLHHGRCMLLYMISAHWIAMNAIRQFRFAIIFNRKYFVCLLKLRPLISSGAGFMGIFVVVVVGMLLKPNWVSWEVAQRLWNQRHFGILAPSACSVACHPWRRS